jgi:hypothetical protein
MGRSHTAQRSDAELAALSAGAHGRSANPAVTSR